MSSCALFTLEATSGRVRAAVISLLQQIKSKFHEQKNKAVICVNLTVMKAPSNWKVEVVRREG